MEIHRRFCERLPEELLRVEEPDTRERLRVDPGALRERHVQVGGHIPVSPGAVPRFLDRFEVVYSNLGKADTILASAAAHHRLLWIHPFLDGNGRVARLMSYAMLREIIDTGGVWSIARGLARNVENYKMLLAACDAPRPQRPRWTRRLERRGVGGIHPVLSPNVHRSGEIHGELDGPGPAADPNPDLGRRGSAGRRPAAEIRSRARGGSIPGGTAAWRCCCNPGDPGETGTPSDRCTAGGRNIGVGKFACTSAIGFSGKARLALDAWIVS